VTKAKAIRLTAEALKAALERAGVTGEQIETAFEAMTAPSASAAPPSARTVATDAQVRRSPPGVYRVTNARRLYLKKTSGDAGSYFLRYRFNGKRPEMGLGSIAELSIDAARDLAGEHGRKPKKGIDPLAERRRQRASENDRKEEAKRRAAIPTVEQAVEAYLKAHAFKWRHGRAEQDWLNPIQTHAYPLIGHLKVDVVEAADIAAVLQAIRAKGLSSVGRKVLVALRAVFAAALALKQRPKARGNPADKDEVNAITPIKNEYVTQHYRRIDLEAAPAAFARLKEAARENVAAAAWVFMALTAARPSEALAARWDQIDLGKGVWLNPALKARDPGDPLPVPLSSIALEILREMQAIRRGNNPFVFPGLNGPQIAYTAFATAPRKAGIDAGAPHSWRSIFRDAAEDRCGFHGDTAEMALAHSLGEVKGAYRRETAFETRRLLMQAYEDWLTGKADGGNIIAFPGRA
jgi:integrase